jgi:hypothetical protein
MSRLRRLRNAVKRFLEKGWMVVPVPPNEKAPKTKGWQNLHIKESEINEYISDDSNIGLLTGQPSDGLSDVDLDCSEAIELANAFLPYTGRVHGRKSKPKSHYWYVANPIPAPEKFCDIDGTCLLELRSTGQQTIVPPSIHPSGELIEWERRKHPAKVDGTELRIAVARHAAATVFARHWPSQGSRSAVALALAGTLLRAGWDELEVGDFVAVVARAANDEEWVIRKAVARTTKKRLEKDAPATGRQRLAEIMGTDVVDRACQWLGIGRLASRPVEFRKVEAPWPEPLAQKAFYGLAGEVVQAIAPITEADIAGLLAQFLIAFGNTIGRNAHFQLGGAAHRVNLFGVLVGRTAKARKGTSWAEIERLFESADIVWAARCLLPGGLASGEGLIWAVRDPVEKAVRPKKGSQQDQDTTKVVDEGVEDKRLLVIETEFASPLRIIRREGNILSAVIRRAWDKGNLGNLSKHSPARATGAHISIIGHITREELLREFSAAEGSSGFGNRFLWICVRRSQLLPLGGRLARETFSSLVTRVQAALTFGRKTGEVRFSKQAEKLWCHHYPRLSAEVPGLLGAMTMRAEAQVLRLSVIYALLGSSNIITRKHLRAALAVWRYCEDSARYIFGDAFGDPVVDTILRHLRKSPNGLTRTEIREIFTRNRSEAEISNALRVLEEHGLARSVRGETGGRPSERWFAVG